MIKFSSYFIIVAMLFAASLFSCSSDPSGDTPSSSSVKVSSSSGSSSITTDNPDLIKKPITLSYTGKSYADIDGDVVTYKQKDIASIMDKIELIAYCGTLCDGNANSIYSPWEIDSFWTNNYEDYLGGEVYFLEITPVQKEIFETATKLSEVKSTMNDIMDIYNSMDDAVDEIPIEAGRAFFVSTSDLKKCIVIIKAAGNQSVNLEIIQVPY